MKLYFKYIWKVIRKDIYQPLMLMLIIILSCSIFFASLNFLNIYEQYYFSQKNYEYGDSDLAITIGSDSKTRWMQKKEIDQLLGYEDKAYAMYVFSSLFEEKGQNFLIKTIGMDFGKANEFQAIEFIEMKKEVENLDTIAIISERFSKKYNIQLNQTFQLKMADRYRTYTVNGIAKDTGIFFEKDILLNDQGVIDTFLESLGLSILKGSKIYNQFQIKTKDVEKLQERLQNSEYFQDKEISHRKVEFPNIIKNNYHIILAIITILTIILCMILIHSILQLLINKRLKILHLFKAVGAKRYQIALCLFLEVFFYGVIGILVSFLGGNILSKIILAKFTVHPDSLKIDSMYYIYTCLFGTGVIFISSISEIYKISTKSLHQLLKNTTRKQEKGNPYTLLILSAITILNYILIKVVRGNSLKIFSFSLLILSITLVYCLTSQIIFFFSHLLKRLKKENFYLVGLLQSNQKSAHNANRLFVLAFMLLITIVGSVSVLKSQINKTEQFFSPGLHLLNVNKGDSKALREINQTQGVDSAYPYYRMEIKYDTLTVDLLGMNSEHINHIINTQKIPIMLYQEFQENSIILPLGLIEKKGLSSKDNITLTVKGKEQTFKIAGYVDTSLMVFIVSLPSLSSTYNSVFIKSTDEQVAYHELSQKYSFQAVYLVSIHNQFSHEKAVISNILNMLKVFILFMFLVLLIGIINNFLMSHKYDIPYYQKLKRIGYSNKQMCLHILLSSLMNAFIFILIIIFGTHILIQSIVGIIKTIGMYSTFYQPYGTYGIILLVGIIIYFLTGLMKYNTYRKIKLNIFYER